MTEPRRPTLPQKPQAPLPVQPDPRHRPDERKEGGPDFGKEAKQKEKPAELRQDARDPPAGLEPD